jgi:hypothetical protein
MKLSPSAEIINTIRFLLMMAVLSLIMFLVFLAESELLENI